MPPFMRFSLAVLGLLALSRRNCSRKLRSLVNCPGSLFQNARIRSKEMNRRKALTLYGLGMQRIKEDRLVEATHLLEDARKLDLKPRRCTRDLSPLLRAWTARRWPASVPACALPRCS